jgi:hypothetical protein
MNAKSTKHLLTPLYGGVGSEVRAVRPCNTGGYQDNSGRQERPATPLYCGVGHGLPQNSQDRAHISGRTTSTRHTRSLIRGLGRAFTSVRSAGGKPARNQKSAVISRVLPANTERLPFSPSPADIDLYLNGILKLATTVARWRTNNG